MQSLIRHIILELNDCPFDVLNNLEGMETLLVRVAQAMNTEIMADVSHHFEPYGITAVLIVGASHLSIHTWPEFGYAALDMVVCTDDFDLAAILRDVQAQVGAQRVSHTEFRRGIVAEHERTS